MDGRQKPDPQPENENELKDEQVIDLTQIVEGGDDNDVINLTDILEKPDQALDAAVEPEAADDEIIDLMDVATTLAGDTAGTDMQAPATPPEAIYGTGPEDEPVIDLLDAVEPQSAEAETTVETDDDFTELESRAEAVLTGAGEAFDGETAEESAETAGPDSDFMIVDDSQAIIGEIDDQPEEVRDASESVADPLAAPLPPSEPVPLTGAQIEAALERAIEKIYGDKIEQLMIRAIEKTVTREIARIKNALLEDNDDMVE